eukprot:3183674-Alexandrium_andersonii.AAC.1
MLEDVACRFSMTSCRRFEVNGRSPNVPMLHLGLMNLQLGLGAIQAKCSGGDAGKEVIACNRCRINPRYRQTPWHGPPDAIRADMRRRGVWRRQ